MFGNKARRIAELERKVHRLEEQMVDLSARITSRTQMTIYNPNAPTVYVGRGRDRYTEMDLTDVIRRLMDYVGVKLEYHPPSAQSGYVDTVPFVKEK